MTSVSGPFCALDGDLEEFDGVSLTGYEIHMGLTENLGECVPAIILEDGRTDAWMNEKGTVFGSYLHGLFDSDGLVSAVVSALFEKKGIDPEAAAFDLAAYKENQYDHLADLIRQSLDMEKIYRILNEGV